MTKGDSKVLNIVSAVLGVVIALCVALGIFAMIIQRTPKLNPAAYQPPAITETTGTEPVEVTQNYESFTVSAAEAS